MYRFRGESGHSMTGGSDKTAPDALFLRLLGVCVACRLLTQVGASRSAALCETRRMDGESMSVPI